MDLSMILPLYVIALLILLFSGMPIAMAFGTIAIGLYFGFGHQMLLSTAYVTWTMLSNFVMVAIPLFILMGLIMSETGFAEYIFKKISPLLDRLLPGGLLQTNIMVGAIFAAFSGSSVATCATIGTVSLPEMEKRGYARSIAAGSVAAGGTLGILIPPSITMIIYGAMTDTSTGRLFMGGVIPGLILTASYMMYIAVRLFFQPKMAPMRGQDLSGKYPWGYCVREFFKVVPVLVALLSILSSIYIGVATPSEAAALGCVIMLIIAITYRMAEWQKIKRSILQAVKTSSMVLVITMGAALMGIYLSNAGIPAAIAKFVASLGLSPVAIFFVLFVLYLILGCLMDGISMMVMTLPIVFPVARANGFDPVWFGVIMTMFLECGLLTPPVGINLFILMSLRPDFSYKDIVGGCLPFFCVLAAVIVLMATFPQLVTYLPSMMVGK
jgi:C4-dicarboxylate transporter DctM subunit